MSTSFSTATVVAAFFFALATLSGNAQNIPTQAYYPQTGTPVDYGQAIPTAMPASMYQTPQVTATSVRRVHVPLGIFNMEKVKSIMFDRNVTKLDIKVLDFFLVPPLVQVKVERMHFADGHKESPTEVYLFGFPITQKRIGRHH